MTSIAKDTERSAYVTRESVLTLLSDDEVARVSMAEADTSLSMGDEYIDLEQIPLGVQHAGGRVTPMGRVLPRNAVHPDTWAKILALLA